ncbi:helix-turn-helix transcriptional regulator [Ornithinimicrobium pekingense]|uniref:HTH cro/C1-type domain-containing protein n=1 Tax=Ornithinimicrobium pekingense TaxID=384677 RepID=A0ABQ2F6L7_9MICO|nr:helix-turn-helix transcriptional regulator [Ornithinimicrobium pekingense]GGK64053.1 hypothetical protein GCM10011509_10570 [Ornithinimicrobium pekingense]
MDTAPAGQWESNLRERLVQWRERRGWTQTDLARELRNRYGLPFHQQTVQRVESGVRPVRLNEAYAIAQLFELELGELTESHGTPRAVKLAIQNGLSNLSQLAEEVVEKVSSVALAAERVYHSAGDEWFAYVERQERAGEQVDPELKREWTEFEQLWEGANEAWSHNSIKGLAD